ncbi:hypothetical protein EJ06DRAFT_504513 [Trichodelitschia bisporula]|uniref:Fumarylacetoacetase-like C-terminal domain-containing protein n=1 Tax=Trichodelitschia bisporula TaxID=703511 RepID=A0A6G1I564_9PEZI|nr:hypothetical protein EJ06DRAFT_504513 [Trichodelitschia bisporula]
MLRTTMAATTTFKRLIRFTPHSSPTTPLIGQPTSDHTDIGLAFHAGSPEPISVYSGSSILSPGTPTGAIETLHTLLSPLAPSEVGTIRCIGLNYKQHAAEVGMDLPTVPTVFLKPSTSLAGPGRALLPHVTREDDTGDFESELVVVIGKEARNVSEAEALDYVLGYTAGNDVSSRGAQFAQSQWCYSKGFDGSAPIGPALVSAREVPDPSKLRMRGLLNGEVMQDCGIDDMVFSVAKLVSFLSQGTTLPPGTCIMTGTPAGVGISKKPAVRIRGGDEFRVEIVPLVGTLVNRFEYEE